MATPLQLQITSSIPTPSSSNPSLRRRSVQTLRCTNSRNVAKFPVPPVNPNVRNVAAAASFDVSVLGPQPKNSNSPDMASSYLNDRQVIVYLPIFPMVTELVIAQLMYLEAKDPDEPITLILQSIGYEDDEIIVMETEGFAMYDALRQLQCVIRTVAMADVKGQACLLVAAGTKGKRGMLPHARAMIHQPGVPATGLMHANDVDILIKEVVTQEKIIVELLAKHTGQSVETIANDMRSNCWWSVDEAIEYGIVDVIIGNKASLERRHGKKFSKKAPTRVLAEECCQDMQKLMPAKRRP